MAEKLQKGKPGTNPGRAGGTEPDKFRYAGACRLSFRGIARLSLIFKESP